MMISEGEYLFMNEKNMGRTDEIELDLQRIFNVLWNRKLLIAIVSVLCAAVALVSTLLFVTPKYEASAMFYVNNTAPAGESSSGVSSSDITASKNLVESYIVILKTRDALTEVIEYADVDLSYDDLSDMIYAESVDETEIFRVVVTSPDPVEAEKLARAIADVLPGRLASIIEGTSAKVVDVENAPESPSSPSYTYNALFGFLIGFVVMVGIIVLRTVFDTTIRTDEDVEQVCKHPVLASVPDMGAVSKGGHEYGADRKKKKTAAAVPGKKPVVVGGGISFAAAEAYKLLRTKLQFSFADDNDCRIIGVSSALSGEGKSLSSINLAYTLSQMNKKVILIDCDMRRPTLAEKLHIRRKPGLSSLLTGQTTLKGLIQYCGIKGEETAFHVITAGQNPPNPMELLGSERMARVLEGLRKMYDYIILDLPPVGEVGDAMAVAKQTDGILLVVRHNYCNRIALADAARQFEFIDAKILGVVCNCATEETGKYGSNYYKKYYGRNDRKYENSYAVAAERTAQNSVKGE